MKFFLKRIMISLGVLISLFLIAAIIIPIIYKDKIMIMARQQINSHLTAHADFKQVKMSLINHFPNLTVSLVGLTIINNEPFEDDTLVAAKSIDITVNLLKALKGNYDVSRIDIINPRIHALVNEKGEANWNITKPDTMKSKTGEKTSGGLVIKLRKYFIENGFIEYKDQHAKIHTVIEKINHSGEGDFTKNQFTLKTKTSIASLTVSHGKIMYLKKAKSSVDLNIDINNITNTYTFNTDKIQLNGLRIISKGFIQIPDTVNTKVNIEFNAPSTDFKDILSLVPSIYLNHFKEIKTSGMFVLNGKLKGTYNTNEIPAFDINLQVKDGTFQYPDLPDNVSNIQIYVHAYNPDGVIDHTIVHIDKGHIEMGKQPLDIKLVVKTPLSNLWVYASLKGQIDLSKVKNIVKLEPETELKGMIKADASFTGPTSAFGDNRLDEVNALGDIRVNDVYYTSKEYPEGIKLNSLILTFSPENVSVTNLNTQYKKTHLTGEGSIDNLIGYYLHSEVLTGNLNIHADLVDVNEWISAPVNYSASEPSVKKNSNNKKSSKVVASSANPIPILLVPDNVNLTLNSTLGIVKYDSCILSNLSGIINISDQTIFLKKISASGLGGNIQINGYYSTKLDKKKPDILFAYDVDNVDIQQAYIQLRTFVTMIPMAKYVTGSISSQFNIDGKMGANMIPEIKSLSGKGNITVLNCVMRKFAPIEELKNKLHIKVFRSMVLKDTKIDFNIENGRINVEPFSFKVDGITFEIAGSHGFDESMEYGVNAKVPKNKLDSNANSDDSYSVSMKFLGKVSKPLVKSGRDIPGNAVNDVNKHLKRETRRKIDSARTAIKDSMRAAKKEMAKAAKDALKNQLLNSKDSSERGFDKFKYKAENKLKELFKSRN